jgi:3-phytase
VTNGLRPGRAAALLCILALLAACSGGPTPASGNSYPLVESAGFSGSGDISDDSAIWVNQTAPGASVVIADNKADAGGGIGVFDMRGKLVQFRADGKIGNVDLREGFRLEGRDTIVVAANNRSDNTLSLWALEPTTRTLASVGARSIATSTGSDSYGLCLYHSMHSGKLYAFVTPNGGGSIQQFELFDNGKGMVDARSVRTLPISSITESCVADDDLGHLYVGQEDIAIWKYGAEPHAGAARSPVDMVGAGHLAADIEGMAIAYGAKGAGYLFVSSQGSSTLAVYDRAGANRFVRSFKVVANGTIDAVSGTDGLDVTSRSVGPGFEKGMLVVHDESNSGGATSNLKYVPLDQVVAVSPPTYSSAPRSGSPLRRTPSRSVPGVLPSGVVRPLSMAGLTLLSLYRSGLLGSVFTNLARPVMEFFP